MDAYAVKNLDKKILDKSSSGGVFYLLSKYIIEKLNGVVYGASIENGNVFHKRVDNIVDIWLLMKSKYVQSDIGRSFFDCSNDLHDGRFVLFCGTPCQIGSLVAFLDSKSIDKSKLITVDFVCHGTPQKKYWDLYKKEMCGDETILGVDFRNKKKGWEKYNFTMSSASKTVDEPASKNKYMTAFLMNYILMESCFRCPFKGENRKSDITLGDFWGIKRYYPDIYDKNGVSLVIVRSKEEFFKNALTSYSLIKKVDYFLSLIQNPSYFLSSLKPDDCHEVQEKIEKNGFKGAFAHNRCSVKSTLAGLLKSLIKLILKKRAVNPNIKGYDVGIITDHGYTNFGNRLQNYALRITLNNLGYKPINLYMSSQQYHLINLQIIHLKSSCLSKRREEIIRKAAIKSGDLAYGYDYSAKCKTEIGQINNILIGSDQTWNYTYHKYRIPFNLGGLCDYSNHNFVSYAASIGADEITDEYAKLFENELRKFSALSVREKRAKEILKDLGFESKVLLDPTLLLSNEEWIDAINKYATHKIKTKNYILKYCLTNIDYKIDGEVIDVLDINSNCYCSNHFDFINLIRNSSLVVTDSFHAFVFSIIFRKEIILLPRESMKSRFESLCSILGIEYKTNVKLNLSNLDLSIFNDIKRESICFLKSNLR